LSEETCSSLGTISNVTSVTYKDSTKRILYKTLRLDYDLLRLRENGTLIADPRLYEGKEF